MANMLKGFWPNGPQDQTTPKASSSSTRSEESNPFDTFSVSSALPSTTNNNNNNVSVGGPGQPAGRMGSSSNLNLNYNQQQPPTPSRSDSHSRGNSANNIIPGLQDGLRTPGGVTSQASIPTTSVSTSAPDFTMKLPPAKNKVESTATNSNPSSSSTRNTTSSRGHLTIKIVEARNLPISSSTSRPYAVVQFDKNEFIGREPIDSADEDAKGTAVPRTELQESNNVRARAKTVTPTIGKESLRQNPVWKHEVTFDVTHENCPIYISVYDREGEEEGFVGMREIRPRLVNKLKSDQWYPLVSKEFNSNENASEEDLTSGGGGGIGGGAAASSEDLGQGEVRIEMKYEKLAQKKLTPRDFEYLKLIGRGTFGKVFQVRKKDTRRIYAMKVLSKREIAIKKEVTHTMGERRILEKSLDCPFLVGLKFSFQSEFELFFVTDYKSGGELFWHLQREGRFTEERARFYIAELVLALEHLHKFDIVYRDLKPENILLDATGHVALCDFGLSKPDLGQGQLTNTFCGTTEYLAPEVLLDESGYSKLVDFWSLGVLLFEMCCGWSPFYAEDTQQMYRNICFGKIKFPRGAIGDDGKQFVKGLLNRNPKHRLGSQRDALDLKEHSFFKDVDFVALAAKQLTPPFKPLVESDESVANFDPEFTETDLQDVAFIPGFDGEESSGMSETVNGMNSSLIDAPTIGTSNNHSNGNQGVKISNKKEDGQVSGEGEGALSRSVQDKFRGFSYSGTYEGSLAGSFGGRRGSGGMGGINLGMSKMEKSDEEKSDVEMDG